MAISDFSGLVPLFFEGFLSKPASALPKGAQWVVDFEGLQDVKQAIQRTTQLEPRKWDIEKGLNLLTSGGSHNSRGFLFAQAVSVPGEQTITNPEGIQKNQFIQTTTGDGRSAYGSSLLNVVFLETNVSFVENVIRPWVVTTGRLGMVARSGKDQYRQDISVYKIGVLTPSTPPFVLMKYTFYGTCPVSVEAEEFNYSPTTGPIQRSVSFLYRYYDITTYNNPAITENNTNIPVSEATSVDDINNENTENRRISLTPKTGRTINSPGVETFEV